MSTDEVQKYRLRVPEPSHVDLPMCRFVIEPEAVFLWNENPNPFYTMKIGEFVKIMVRERGIVYEAWSMDGKTPIFPIPL